MGYLEEIDIESAKERFMGNEALFKRFLMQLPEKKMMEELEENLSKQDVDAAFKTAHTMKGVVGNLSLNKLMSVLSEVVEILRAGSLPEDEKMEGLRAAYAVALEAIEEVREQNIALF